MSSTVVLLLFISISTEILREVCFKLAANKAPVVKQGGSRYLAGLFFRPLIWLGFFPLGGGIGGMDYGFSADSAEFSFPDNEFGLLRDDSGGEIYFG